MTESVVIQIKNREKFPDHVTVKLKLLCKEHWEFLLKFFTNSSLLRPALRNQAYLNADEENQLAWEWPRSQLILHAHHTLYIHMTSQWAKGKESTKHLTPGCTNLLCVQHLCLTASSDHEMLTKKEGKCAFSTLCIFQSIQSLSFSSTVPAWKFCPNITFQHCTEFY